MCPQCIFQFRHLFKNYVTPNKKKTKPKILRKLDQWKWELLMYHFEIILRDF